MNIEMLKQLGFEKEVKAIENGLCPFCKKETFFEDFKDAISIKEFKLSGLCLSCQKEMFN